MIFEKDGKRLNLEQFTFLTQAKWQPFLAFDPNALGKIVKTCSKLHRRGEIPIEQMWFGKFFEKELALKHAEDLSIRWIDEKIGWGVFAMRKFSEMEFIAEYSGNVRKKRKADSQNSYCFEYAFTSEERSPYTVDAMDQGGVARYINHSESPNLTPALAYLGNMTRIILYTNRPIAKDEQLCYNYGPGYWSKRAKPILL
jgi:hypothetical protein